MLGGSISCNSLVSFRAFGLDARPVLDGTALADMLADTGGTDCLAANLNVHPSHTAPRSSVRCTALISSVPRADPTAERLHARWVFSPACAPS